MLAGGRVPIFMSRITDFDTADIRFPTSLSLDGSDAMNPDPDYSAAYVRIATDAGDAGHGFVFTIGRGNDVQVAAIDALRDRFVDREAEELLVDMGAVWRELVHDSQLRWLGPEKGVMHMAVGAVVNALWDLKAKRAGLPLWDLLSGMSPEELVGLVDFRYLTDALTREQALEILRASEPGRAARREQLLAAGYPAYTTTPGWLGYDDAKLARLCGDAVEEGFELIKLKVGGDLADDIRRLAIARDVVGPEIRIAVDANQRWDVADAIEWMRALQPYDVAWIEEPTNPDDVLGHAAIARGVAPIPVATGEHMANRVMFKQFLQAEALHVLQIDATRVAGVNENVAIILLAAKFGVPVCPHAGGVGLCEAVQHLAMFDFVAVSGSLEGRLIEFVDHLHEHFVTPVEVRDGRYLAPTAPGAGTEMLAESRA
jgi:L-fuconate dehydratase